MGRTSQPVRSERFRGMSAEVPTPHKTGVRRDGSYRLIRPYAAGGPPGWPAAPRIARAIAASHAAKHGTPGSPPQTADKMHLHSGHVAGVGGSTKRAGHSCPVPRSNLYGKSSWIPAGGVPIRSAARDGGAPRPVSCFSWNWNLGAVGLMTPDRRFHDDPTKAFYT
jgi:hypothetical protein